MANLTNIFTGMDKGPEQIMNDLNALNSDLSTVSGVANSAFQVGNFIGVNNQSIDNISSGIHELGFWAGQKLQAGNGWPASMVGWDQFYGGLIQTGDPTAIGQQILIVSPYGLAYRDHAGDTWSSWFKVTCTEDK